MSNIKSGIVHRFPCNMTVKKQTNIFLFTVNFLSYMTKTIEKQ